MAASEVPGPALYGPLSRSERLVSIDFVRGVALLGILLVNAGSFFGPMMADSRPNHVKELETHDLVARFAVSAFCFTKFISIFAMLFGYGLLTQVERVADAGRSPWWFGVRRLLTLAVIGLVHGLALWYGDILFTYATLGLFVVIFRRVREPRDLLLLAGALLAYVAVLRVGGEFLNLAVTYLPTPPGGRGDRRGLNAIVASGINPYSDVWREAEIVACSEGPYKDLFAFRVAGWLFVQSSMFLGSWPLVVGLFVVGMWLKQVRFFDPDRAALRRKTLLICLPLGLGVEAVAAVCYSLGLTGPAVLWTTGSAVQAFSLPFLSLGYLAVMTAFVDAVPRWLTWPVVCAGRMPLTVYLSETVIATTLAYHYGFGLFGSVGPALQVGVSLCIWGGLVLFSWGWMTLVGMGPMEWFWRMLEYGSVRQREARRP